MGYPRGQKGYKFYDLETNKFFVSRDVQFHETTFPFSTPSSHDHFLTSSSRTVPKFFFDDLSNLTTSKSQRDATIVVPHSSSHDIINQRSDVTMPVSSPHDAND